MRRLFGRAPALLVLMLALLGLLAGCGDPAPATPAPLPPTTVAPAATAPPAASATPAATATAPAATAPPAATPTALPATALPSPVPVSPTVDAVARAAYATITALAQNAAATATAAAAPTATAGPPPPAPPVPAAALGTYRLIITARAEGYRVYQVPGTLVLRTPVAGSGHSAELQLAVGVRAGHEYLDLSPGKTVGGLYLTTAAALLPKGFAAGGSFAVSVVYDPKTKYLNVAGDPAHGLPGGWSTGPNNKARAPRPITAGTLTLDLGTAGYLSGQVDLHSTAPGQADLAYSGGVQAQK